MLKRITIKSYEKGLMFKNDEFQGLLGHGRHLILDPLNRIRVDVASQRDPWLTHCDLDIIIRSGVLDGIASIYDLNDNQRGLVWIDGRFNRIIGPGLYALWTGYRDIRCDIVETDTVRFQHRERHAITASPYTDRELTQIQVHEGFTGVFFRDNTFSGLLEPGNYMFWKNSDKVSLYHVDMRLKTLDISGQDIMTSDKVTLRLNVVLNYRVTDPLLSVSTSADTDQTLYRETQLAVRSVVGSHDLDTLLSDKERVAEGLELALQNHAGELGLSVVSLGIRDIILPGDMKELLNRVIEAKKAADANLITRREETAAMRSQANTAKLLENNPTLMRLRELDVLEKIISNSKMSLVLGEKGLADRVVNLL